MSFRFLIATLGLAGGIAFAKIAMSNPPAREPAGVKLQQLMKESPKIKNLDLSFACSQKRVSTADECYYRGLVHLHRLGCQSSGEVSSKNCGVLKSEWVCSVTSENCKEVDETQTYRCPLHYREANVRDADVLGNGKVMVDFLFYCIKDPIGGRTLDHVISQNAPASQQ